MVLLSPEQQLIFDRFTDPNWRYDHAACIQAVAGSGKTTLLMEIAKKRYDLGLGSTLILNFSKDLKEASREKGGNANGIHVENVHSLVKNILLPGTSCNTKKHLEDYLALETKPLPHPDFLKHISLICFDEMQDIDDIAYKILQQLRSFFTQTNPSFIGVGDFFQWILKHINNSSAKYMCNPKDYFPSDHFEMFRLSYSYRLTPQMANWINTNLNPMTIKQHFPGCWEKYGQQITEYWGDGIKSAKCAKCGLCNCIDFACDKIPQPRVQPPEVDVFEYTFQELVPRNVNYSLRFENAILMLNGLAVNRYNCKFPNVTTPQSFKGCEAKEVVVLGFDLLFEQVCAKSVTYRDQEDWPLICYCQMYVSCTRASHRLSVCKSKSRLSFFTVRQAHLFDVLTQTAEPDITGNRSLSRLFDFVPEDPELDSSVSVKIICETKQNVMSPPNFATGVIPGTLVCPFAHFYHDAVRLAFGLTVQNPQLSFKDEWTDFMRKTVLQKIAKDIHPKWKADEEWCETSLKTCKNLFESYFNKSVECNAKMVKVNYLRLTTDIHLVLKWCGILQITFQHGEVKNPMKYNRHLQQQFTSFICYKRTHKFEYLQTCFVLNVADGTLSTLSCRFDEDYFLGELVRRKSWKDMLPKDLFEYWTMASRGVAIPYKRLMNTVPTKQAQVMEKQQQVESAKRLKMQ